MLNMESFIQFHTLLKLVVDLIFFFFLFDLQTLPVKLAERHNSLHQLLWPLFLPYHPWYSTEDRPQHRELRALLLVVTDGWRQIR